MLYRLAINISFALFLSFSLHAQIHKRMRPFLGTWDYENIRGFEVWQTNGRELQGKGFRIKNENDTVLIETMRVTMENGKLVLYALVVNQNDGKEIRFEESEKLRYKFVNESHDFPKSIYYKFRRFRRKRVQVLLNHPHYDTHTKPISMIRKK